MPAGQDVTIAEVIARAGGLTLAATSVATRKKNLLIMQMSPSWNREQEARLWLVKG
jgi:hypothetical protein